MQDDEDAGKNRVRIKGVVVHPDGEQDFLIVRFPFEEGGLDHSGRYVLLRSEARDLIDKLEALSKTPR